MTSSSSSWPELFELCCCSVSYFSLSPLELCPSCVQPSAQHTKHTVNVGPIKERSVVVKPTMGSFSRYDPRMLLHCGVSDSKSKVYNFDERGPCIDNDWKESISIPIEAPHLTDSQWDAALARHHDAEKTFERARPYSQLANNCYDYVIRFLNGIKFEGKEDHTKEGIVARFIQTPIDAFESFFAVLQRVKSADAQRQGFVKIEIPPSRSSHACDACGEMISPQDTRYRCVECQDFDLCSRCSQKTVAQHKPSHRMLSLLETARYSCDGCASPITNRHYRCLECLDFDFCDQCHQSKLETGAHTKHHRMVQV